MRRPGRKLAQPRVPYSHRLNGTVMRGGPLSSGRAKVHKALGRQSKTGHNVAPRKNGQEAPVQTGMKSSGRSDLQNRARRQACRHAHDWWPCRFFTTICHEKALPTKSPPPRWWILYGREASSTEQTNVNCARRKARKRTALCQTDWR